MSQNTNFTTPVGRLVRGSLYKPNDKDAEGKPLVVKSGPNAGQPRVEFYFALAVPKGAEQHWSQTPWGLEILKVGAAAFPQAYQSPAFAWKITDGDSAVPNKKGKKPCDAEGYRGNWVLGFSSGFKPRLYKARPGGAPDQFDSMPDHEEIKLGYFAQVNFNCGGNGSQSQPGVFLNHSMVCFSAFGAEISVGPDAASAGFGQGALPAGASLTPPPGAFAGMAPALGGAVGAPGFPQLPGGLLGSGMSAPAAGFPQLPGIGMAAAPGFPAMGAAAPAFQMPAPAGPQYQMLPAAQGHSREQWNAQGVSDEQLLAASYMVLAAATPPAMPQMPAFQMPGQPAPLAPGFSVPVVGAFAAPIAGAPGVQIPVMPNPAFVQIPAAAGWQMTPKAQQAGVTMAGLQAQGWDEANARAHGWIA